MWFLFLFFFFFGTNDDVISILHKYNNNLNIANDTGSFDLSTSHIWKITNF
jgi:hypothetical protein